MNTTAAPTPWVFTGSSICDAEGRLVCVLAQRLLQAGIVDAICAAPEMHALLLAIENELAKELPEVGTSLLPTVRLQLLLDDVRAMLERVGGAP